jgi:hypothetical protein
MRKLSVYVFGSIFAFAVVSGAQQAVPGTINCVEGHVALDSQAIAAGTVGAAVVNSGHLLETAQGKAEVLLSPGVFLRVGENSGIKMEAASGKEVRVELVRGEAMVEVDNVDKADRLDVIDKGADARVDHSGIYLFNADQPAVLVYNGRVRVEDDRRGFAVRQGEELLLSGSIPKIQKLDRNDTNALYSWTLQRADYASQVSEWTVEALLSLDDGAQYTAGWYWNPWYNSWAFVLPKGRSVSPLGYGYYAPSAVQSLAPVFGDFR